MSIHSPAGRHALRLAVIVPVAALIARELPLQRSYWMVVAAATVLRPEFGATFTRGAERALGTCLGVGLAGAIAVTLHPAGGATIVLVGALAWAGYSLFPASFAVGYGFITALVVFLLNAVSPDTLATATDRLVDTLVGGAIGLLAYALWPTWAHTSAWQSLSDLVGAERAYVDGVLTAAAEGRRPGDQRMRSLARRARLGPDDRRVHRGPLAVGAEHAADRRLSEPAGPGGAAATGPGRARAAPRRPGRARAPSPAGAATAPGGDRRDPRRGGGQPPGAPAAGAHAPRAARHPRALRGLPARVRPRIADALALLAELDEIVDAANSLAAAAGLEGSDEDDRPEA